MEFVTPARWHGDPAKFAVYIQAHHSTTPSSPNLGGGFSPRPTFRRSARTRAAGELARPRSGVTTEINL